MLGHSEYAGYVLKPASGPAWDGGVIHQTISSFAPSKRTVQFYEAYAGVITDHVSARLYSADTLAGIALASFGVWREFNEFRSLSPPEVSPLGADEAPVVTSLGVATHDHFDMYPRIGTFSRGGGDAHVGGCRHRRTQA